MSFFCLQLEPYLAVSHKKKQIRSNFRSAVFARDGYRCVICGKKADKGNPEAVLDAHHIVPREEMPNGGYVKENGISLCNDICHLKAEEYLQGIALHEGFSPEKLYQKIGSNKERAVRASQRLS